MLSSCLCVFLSEVREIWPRLLGCVLLSSCQEYESGDLMFNCMSCATHMNESCHACEWVMYINESCRTCKCVMARANTIRNLEIWLVMVLVMSQTWTSHATHITVSWCGHISLRIWRSNFWCLVDVHDSFTWLSHVHQRSGDPTFDGVSHVTHINEWCHTYQWIMAHVSMCYVSQINEVWRGEHKIINLEISRGIWVMSRAWMSHVTHMYESRHTYQRVMACAQTWLRIWRSCLSMSHVAQWVMSHTPMSYGE